MQKTIWMRALAIGVFLFSGLLFAEDAAEYYAQVCARYPELGLDNTATTPTLHVVTTATELQTAITKAKVVAGDDLILLDASTAQTWELSSTITVEATAEKGAIIIASKDATCPVTLKGRGIAVSVNNTAPLYFAQFGITESTTALSNTFCCGISVLGSGSFTATCLSIIACGSTNTTLAFQAGAVYVLNTTAIFYNCTFANNASATHGAVTNRIGTVSLIHCTLSGNKNYSGGIIVGGTVAPTLTNCWATIDTLELTSSTSALPHWEPTADSGAVNAATTDTVLAFDALGNARVIGAAADLGAVEYAEAVMVEPPADLIALPSGPREVYLGWSVVPVAQDYRLERSLDGTTDWVDVTDSTLWRTPYDAEANPEGTVEGWTSARYVAATPGETAWYRLSFAVEGQAERVVAEPLSVTSPALDAVPCYHSCPTAKQVIYLDFTGYVDDFKANVMSARLGLEDSSLTFVQTAPFAYKGRFGDLTQTYPTADAIYDIWRMVAEDFAAFEVDVTTEAPTYEALVKTSETDMAYGKRVVIGYATGTSTPWYVGGGAFSGGGTFGFQYDRPVYVFSQQSRQNIAAQVTHEVGHTLGLAHDGGTFYFDDMVEGTTDFYTSDYYRGVEITRSGAVNTTLYAQTDLEWFPVMGGAPTPSGTSEYFYDDGDFINQWNSGTYSSAKNTEDDFAILLGLQEGSGTSFTETPCYAAATRSLSLREDEAGDTLATAKALGALSETATTVEAIIGKQYDSTTQAVQNDVDVFAVTVQTPGTLSVKVTPNYKGLTEGSSLDAMVEVVASDETTLQVATEPIWTNEVYFNALREAECQLVLPVAGTYYLRVSGTAHLMSSATLSPDGSASEATPWYFNATTNEGSIGPYTLATTFDADATLAFPKPFIADTTDYTDAAKLKLIAATGGQIPATLSAFDGATTGVTAATVSEALACFDGILTVSEDKTAVSINWQFDVTSLVRDENDNILIEVAVTSADETTSAAFSEQVIFSLYNVTTETETTLDATVCQPLNDARSRFLLTLPAQDETHLFRIRLSTSD